jgi:sporulation protein YlmC with PRC-barrel domain
MRKTLLMALTLMLAFALASTAFAVGETGGGTMAPGGTMGKTTMGMDLNKEGIRTSQLMNLEVKDTKGEKVGAVNDVIIDPKTGRVAFAVIEGDPSFVGTSGKLYAIPWHALKASSAGDYFVLNVTKDKMEKAPSFSMEAWPNIADRSWMTEVYKYYGQTPYWQEKAPVKKERKSGY